MNEQLKISLANLPPVARLDEYFGLWAIEVTRFLSAFDRARAMDLRSHVQQSEKPRLQRQVLTTNMAAPNAKGSGENPNPATGKIAVIPLSGTLMKQLGSMEEGTSTVQARADIRHAAGDASIDGILLLIDSPGGTVAGSADLAAEVRAANAIKPVYAFAEDLLASAAYRVALGAQKIFANEPGALVGSIGTIIALYDCSGAAAMQGIKAKVYATGPLKATGMEGTEITPAQDAYLQGIVDQTQKYFNSEVMSSRGLDAKQLAAVNTGAVFLASEAQKLGLIDGVMSLDQVIAEMSAAIGRPGGGSKSKQSPRAQGALPLATETPQEEIAMSDPTKETAIPAASLKELQAALPKASSDFLVKSIGDGLTVAQAKDRYIESMTAENDDLKANAKTIGTQALATTPKADAASSGEFTELVAAKRAAHPNMARRDAIKSVARENPEAHAAFVAGCPKAKR